MNQDFKPVRIGIIGYGWWGKIMANYISTSPYLKLIAVCETQSALREEMKKDAVLQGAYIDENLDQTLAHSELEAVILATPHQEHAHQMQKFANKKIHIFCEKPLCLTLEDAKKSIAACTSNGLVLGIGHERRFEPQVIKLRKMIAQGDLGEILQIEGNFSQDKFLSLAKDNWRLSNEKAPVGPLTATGIHLVDLSVAVLGPCESIWARLSTKGSDFANGDTLAIMMGFPNGSNALISAILATPFEGRFAVYGSKGWVEIRDRTHPENPTGWDITTVIRGKEIERSFSPPAPTVLNNLEAFAKAVRGVAPYPVRHEEMLANVAALEAIMTSVKQQKLIQVQQF